MDINLHASQSFIDQLYIKFEELGHFFDSFYGKRQELQRLVQQGVDFLRVQKVVDEAVEAFFKDYRELANKSRIVLFVDTAEQLNAVVSEWLYTHKDARGQPLLKEEDLRFQTQQWLAKQIEAGHFYNTTIVFAGRDEEGELFFERMNKAIKKAKGIVEIISMKPLKNFGLIKEFFQQLASDWKVRAEEETDQEEKQAAQQMTNNLDELVNSEDMVKVLWLFTGGRPVLLSLYADLLLEPAIGSPEPLLLSWKEAVETVGTDSIESPTLALRWQQWQVEEAFISLIFSSQGQSKTLYRDILQLLVRSPRGLTAEQIHFLLDNEDGIDIKDWEPDQRRLKEIKKVLERWLGRSSLLKVLQHGYRPKEDIYRLQDEIYRIYAEHMAPNKFPAKEVEELWEQHMSANQKKM
jgi:hypothetical protein